MARILVVKRLFPYPPSAGTRRVSLALLRDLAGCHEVVFLCQADRAERPYVPRVEETGARVVAPLTPNRRSPLHRVLYKAKNRVLSRVQGRPELTYYASNHALRANLERLGREFAPDLTILESWETHPLRRSIRGGRAALLAHDVAYQILERAVQATSDPRERERRKHIVAREKEVEIASWRLFDAVMTLTANDRATIERDIAPPAHGRPLVRHLPVPVADEFFAYARPAAPACRIGFLGTFLADFNRDAVEFLLGDIWPRVAARMAQAELVIAGNGDRGPLERRARAAGARWLGLVADLRDFYETIDALVVPLRFGAGVRIRILEALAAGVPVIATPVAAAGLPLTAGEQLLLGGDAQALADAIAWLSEHPEEATGLSARGREWCARTHAASVLRPSRLAVIDEILALPPAR